MRIVTFLLSLINEYPNEHALTDDCKRRVEVIVSSYHGANAFREELVHGFILVYSTKRKASLATLRAFSANIPNLPIQVQAVFYWWKFNFLVLLFALPGVAFLAQVIYTFIYNVLKFVHQKKKKKYANFFHTLDSGNDGHEQCFCIFWIWYFTTTDYWG